jgi:hypothetical protein
MSFPINLDGGLVELCLFTFIPMDFVMDPIGVSYRADGVGFSYERAEFRTRHRLIIDPSKVAPGGSIFGSREVPPGFIIEDNREVGLSVSFSPMLSPPSTMRPWPLFIPRMTLEIDRADPMASVDWSFWRYRSGAFQIKMTANATNPVAITRALVVPAINYTLQFDFDSARKVTVWGFHDGFPAYDLYFQRRHFYRYDPVKAGASPLSLFGVGDVFVELVALQ